MSDKKIYIGNNPLSDNTTEVDGKFLVIDNEKYYQIENYHIMPDFFMNIVSNSNHWMFISSNGSLTAGRRDRNNALFPYYTVDKIHDYKDITGSKSYFIIEKKDKKYLWEPFTEISAKLYNISRSIYKNVVGNKILFEETNHDLGVIFRYGWHNSDEFGFIKTSRLSNLNTSEIKVDILDGIKNILPCGIDYSFQNEFSNLLDAYKKNELLSHSKLGLFMLSSIPVDRAEPSEALKTNVVWSFGLKEESKILLSNNQIDNFKNGYALKEEYDIRAQRGAYFINSSISLEKESSTDWYTVADINKDGTEVSNLKRFIQNNGDLKTIVLADIEKGSLSLKKMVASADGLQQTNEEICSSRHFTNSMYNIMRGGIFSNNYEIDGYDFKNFIAQTNIILKNENLSWLDKIDSKISYFDLLKSAEETQNSDLIRLVYEYLPLTFSRRHGDPSRPWNVFTINTNDENGKIKFDYEGNWRDIFQNWEALCLSFPGFIESTITKFVNASTIDGYNPYRITKNGIDWEKTDPNDSWSYIGYWGDHQIIYLQKLLELSHKFHPSALQKLLLSEIFTYANVPYRIKSYEDILKDPKETIDFDNELDQQLQSERQHFGSDVYLLKNKSDKSIYKVNLTEKILVSLLSKISNFIPEAGIWLNTQRPEWNDANNALVGNGTSMVTLYYLRRFLSFWSAEFNALSSKDISISEEVVELLETINNFLQKEKNGIKNGFSDADRKAFADNLGRAHSLYRNKIYNYSFSGEKRLINSQQLVDFTTLCLNYVDQSIDANKRKDAMYHAYNLISIDMNSISIRRLYEMLEGQVAVLSSGHLSIEESAEVLDALKNSKMYREDQYSYMLYPDRDLPRFDEKNIIPNEFVENSQLLLQLLKDKETSIIKMDESGNYHFNGSFRNTASLEESLDKLRVGKFSHIIDTEKEKVLSIYNDLFDHQSFTGRSGTFFAYEGLGSIYWHMVSKLLLAIQENYFTAVENNADSKIIGKLKDHYYEVKAGIGLYKSPDVYGAFPMDAYSHTPGGAGVKQPGLTGQVKEDVISRLMELGLFVKEGKIEFNISLLNPDEITKHDSIFEYFDINGEKKTIKLNENQIVYTFCQIPIIYSYSEENKIKIYFKEQYTEIVEGNTIGNKLSNKIFTRNGEIEKIEVFIEGFKNNN